MRHYSDKMDKDDLYDFTVSELGSFMTPSTGGSYERELMFSLDKKLLDYIGETS